MCRLFGFRSVIQSQVHQSLVAADNALAVQSQRHPDGWGVAYYIAGAPHVIKSAQTAIEDNIFKRVSGVVSSETVLAHLRKATVGEINLLNSHPFQYGNWVMAHNGEIWNYGASRDKLRAEIVPHLRRYILGDTDSEVLFYLFLTHLAQRTDILRKGAPIDLVAKALSDTIKLTRAIADGPDEGQHSKLTLIVTDGSTMVAARSRMPLRFSTYKTRCLDRDTCPFLAPECEAPTTTGKINHLIISSEELKGDNTWIELQEDEVVGVDWGMNLYQSRL